MGKMKIENFVTMLPMTCIPTHSCYPLNSVEPRAASSRVLPPCVRPLTGRQARVVVKGDLERCGVMSTARICLLGLARNHEEWEPANFVRASFSLEPRANVAYFVLFVYSSYHLILWSKTHLVLAVQQIDLI